MLMTMMLIMMTIMMVMMIMMMMMLTHNEWSYCQFCQDHNYDHEDVQVAYGRVASHRWSRSKEK